MSGHNAWEFGKTGAKWGAIGGALLYGTFPALLAIGSLFTLNPVAIGIAFSAAAGALAYGGVAGGLTGGAIGGTVGAFTKDKGSDLVDVQTPNGQVISVPAKDLQRAQEQESTRFQEMVAQSRGGPRSR